MWRNLFKLFWYVFLKDPITDNLGGVVPFPFIPHMKRPNCKRCGGPLDIFPDFETGRYEWCCNNPKPMFTDEEFNQKWANLRGDDVAKLTREADDVS